MSTLVHTRPAYTHDAPEPGTLIELAPEVQYAGRKIGLDWAEKTAKEGKYPHFAQVFASQKELDALWKGASGWRTVKIKA